MAVTLAVAAALGAALLLYQLCSLLVFGPLSRVPGPKSFALSKWRLAYEDYKGARTRTLLRLHRKYGSVVRVGPNEVSFNSTTALRTIYGAGSGFERTSFYDMFDVYGRKNLFTFHSARAHADRKKLVAHAYAKSSMLHGANAALVEAKARRYLDLIARSPPSPDDPAAARASEIFASLHYFSLDAITAFLYGRFGATACLEGDVADRELLTDIMDTSRRRLSWFAVHLPGFTAWLYSQTGLLGRVAQRFYPMQRPTTYSGIRAHALQACSAFAASARDPAIETAALAEDTLVAKLWRHHSDNVASKTSTRGLDDLDIASELADHLLAGIDTTSDTLMFLLWALSLPRNARHQQRLADEVRAMPRDALNDDDDGIPTVAAADGLPFVHAVVRETLRLYAPLPATEPRVLPPVIRGGGKGGTDAAAAVVIDGYAIPRETVVGVAPYTVHRNGDVFTNPETWDPERWLPSDEAEGEGEAHLAEMNRWWWAFSSGGRMCIGMHIAMAEMTTLVAAIYREYTTTTRPPFDTVSPGITSRFEVFYDEAYAGIREHECYIQFHPVGEGNSR